MLYIKKIENYVLITHFLCSTNNKKGYFFLGSSKNYLAYRNFFYHNSFVMFFSVVTNNKPMTDNQNKVIEKIT